MRASVAIAALFVGLVAGLASARAADLEVAPHGYGACCDPPYGTAEPVVIWDDQPGVAMRRWWLPPWQNRHFYPHGRASLKVGRRRHPARWRPHAGPRYVRYWTNPPVYVLDTQPLIGRDIRYPRRDPRRYPPPSAVGP